MAAGRAALRASAEGVVTGRRPPSPLPPPPSRSRPAQILLATSYDNIKVKKRNDDFEMRVGDLVGNSPRSYRSPHHRMPLHSRNEDSKRRSMTWLDTCASPYRGGSGGRLRAGRRRSGGRRGARARSARARRRAGGPLRTSTCTEMGACLMYLLSGWMLQTRGLGSSEHKIGRVLVLNTPPGDKDGAAQIGFESKA